MIISGSATPFVVASLDNGKERRRTEIIVHEKKELLAWYDRAIKFIHEREYDLEGAFYETAKPSSGSPAG